MRQLAAMGGDVGVDYTEHYIVDQLIIGWIILIITIIGTERRLMSLVVCFVDV